MKWYQKNWVSIPYRQTINPEETTVEEIMDLQFQFLIGRLSTEISIFIPSTMDVKFQFLIGRLSTIIISLPYHSALYSFQFLIGRLSTSPNHPIQLNLFLVSIPYRQTINGPAFVSLISAGQFQFLIGRLSTSNAFCLALYLACRFNSLQVDYQQS